MHRTSAHAKHRARASERRVWSLIVGLLACAACTSTTDSARVSPATVSPASTSTTSPAASSRVGLDSNNPFRTGRTLVIPHAGGDGYFPENTLFAYEQSMAMGGEVIDLDVWLTADNQLIAFHDSTLERTTNGSGRVADTTLAEIRELDAGWTFERDGEFPFRGKGIKVPTIEEVLAAFPTTLTTLDLKDQRVAVVEPLCALLRKLDRSHDVYVGIDVTEQVLAFRKDCPEMRTSGTDEERQASRAAREAGDPNFVTTQLVGQPGYRNDDGTVRITEQTLTWAHDHGTAILTWTVDDPDDMEALVRLGVDGIYTRYPDRLLDVIAKVNAST